MRIDFGFHEIPKLAWKDIDRIPNQCTIDPVIDVTLVNDSDRTGIVTEIGIELLESWTVLKGLKVAHKVLVQDVYILELESLDPGIPQFAKLTDPIAIPPSSPFRYLLWLNDFRYAIQGNESLIRFTVEFEQQMHSSRIIYMSIY